MQNRADPAPVQQSHSAATSRELQSDRSVHPNCTAIIPLKQKTILQGEAVSARSPILPAETVKVNLPGTIPYSPKLPQQQAADSPPTPAERSTNSRRQDRIQPRIHHRKPATTTVPAHADGAAIHAPANDRHRSRQGSSEAPPPHWQGWNREAGSAWFRRSFLEPQFLCRIPDQRRKIGFCSAPFRKDFTHGGKFILRL